MIRLKLLASAGAFSLIGIVSAGVIWDTTPGAPGQTYRASYLNVTPGADWLSVATPVNLTEAASITHASFVGAHLLFDGSNLIPTDPSGSGFRINAWSSTSAFQASPLLGDLWSVTGSYTRTPAGTGGSGNSELSLYRFTLDSSVNLSIGESLVGIYSESLPRSSGNFYWSSTGDVAPSGYRLRSTAPGLDFLPNAQSLRLETAAVPEPSTLLVAGSGIVFLLRRRKVAAKNPTM